MLMIQKKKNVDDTKEKKLLMIQEKKGKKAPTWAGKAEVVQAATYLRKRWCILGELVKPLPHPRSPRVRVVAFFTVLYVHSRPLCKHPRTYIGFGSGA